MMTAEHRRLEETRQQNIPWKKWGPYLSERQWGTVREDYSEGGDAWNFFTHDHARSRAYPCGEDGLGGISDDKQRLCFALALWNGKDPILKERLFGLTNSEGNHGEDLKEYYIYLDSTPTHSYMKFLYKYPQEAYPYSDLVETNRRRNRHEMEYELLDTGVFQKNRYFDVFVEYAKESPEDILLRITVHNRGSESAEIHILPTLWFRNDWSAWMALFTQNMLELAAELAAYDSEYEDMVVKFVEHFYYIAAAMNKPGPDSMWDEEDGFYYDLLRLPDGSVKRLKVRSMVGLLPLCAATVIEKEQRERVPRALTLLRERLRRMPELLDSIHPTGPGHLGVAERGILALVNPERLRRILSRMLDENEFLSPYGIRSLSKFHEQHPYILQIHGQEYRVDYLPAESNTGMFGGNSNWRGPVWMPVNAILIRALLSFYLYYGENFKIECPTGSGRMMNLFEVAKEISDRLTRIFLRDEHGRRPVYGGAETFQTDPHWRDHILFYEYFHGDNGAGLGASHQTGWTGVIAKLIQLFGLLDPKKSLEIGKRAAFAQVTMERKGKK